MAEYLIQDITLTAIGDAIRTKTGKTEAITPENMPTEIDGIKSGSDIITEPLTVEENGTYSAESGKAYTPVTVSVPQTTIEPLLVTENGTYTAEEGKAFSPVNVNVNIGDEEGLIILSDYVNHKPTTLICNCSTDTLPVLITTNNAYKPSWTDYIKRVVTPENVTIIGDYGCCGMGIEEISNWDNITYIGKLGFSRNNNALDFGKGLQYTYLPPNLTYIGTQAFFRNLNKFDGIIPNSVTYIGSYAFRYGGNGGILNQLPSSLVTIDSYAFYLGYVDLQFTTIPATVKTIGAYAFDASNYKKTENLTNVTFEGKPDSIESTAFNKCNNLTEIRVPWAEGEVANAPWGATNATIHYDWIEEGGIT